MGVNPPTHGCGGVVLWRPAVRVGGSGNLRFRSVHEGFDPSGAVDEFCSGYDVLHAAVFHLREETQSGYFCVRHPAEEENQRGSVFPLLACGRLEEKMNSRSRKEWGKKNLYLSINLLSKVFIPIEKDF